MEIISDDYNGEFIHIANSSFFQICYRTRTLITDQSQDATQGTHIKYIINIDLSLPF